MMSTERPNYLLALYHAAVVHLYMLSYLSL